MRNKKEFFGVLISVLVCVFIVSLFVYAASTIGLDVIVDDDLTITGNTISFGNEASISNTENDLLLITEALTSFVGEVSISSNLDVDGTASISDALIVDGYVSVSAGDLSIETGDFSVAGTAFFDGVVSVSDSNGLDMSGGSTIFGDAASPQGSCTKGDVHMNSLANSGTGTDRVISVCDVANEWTAIGE